MILACTSFPNLTPLNVSEISEFQSKFLCVHMSRASNEDSENVFSLAYDG